MATTFLGALALAALPSALAFRDTSPFFLLSADTLSVRGHEASVGFAHDINSQIKDSLAACASHTYLLVRQEGVSSSDYVDRSTAPLQSLYKDVRSAMSVAEVVGQFDVSALSSHLAATCGADATTARAQDLVAKTQARAAAPQVISVQFPPPPSGQDRASVLEQNDRILSLAVANLDADFTVVYTTSPPTEQQIKADEKAYSYEMENPFEGAVRMELKRDVTLHLRASNATQGGLFEKYQYFSPGLFMALSAMVPLVLILLVGVRALTSLEVSYFAFSKEMGPTAQRKQG